MGVLTNELGYTVHEKVINARHFVPQHRERVFIVGFREPAEFAFPEIDTAFAPSLGSILERDAHPKYTLTDHLWQYLQDYAAKHRERGNGFGFGLCKPNDVARTLSARYYKDGSEILVHQPRRNPRRLTPRECARLMGFPEWFKIVVSDTQAYKQFGNAIVIKVVESLAASMLDCLADSGLIRKHPLGTSQRLPHRQPQAPLATPHEPARIASIAG
jgi:DNA (cytosine-5)-methyltransferase 1